MKREKRGESGKSKERLEKPRETGRFEREGEGKGRKIWEHDVKPDRLIIVSRKKFEFCNQSGYRFIIVNREKISNPRGFGKIL